MSPLLAIGLFATLAAHPKCGVNDFVMTPNKAVYLMSLDIAASSTGTYKHFKIEENDDGGGGESTLVAQCEQLCGADPLCAGFVHNREAVPSFCNFKMTTVVKRDEPDKDLWEKPSRCLGVEISHLPCGPNDMLKYGNVTTSNEDDPLGNVEIADSSTGTAVHYYQPTKKINDVLADTLVAQCEQLCGIESTCFAFISNRGAVPPYCTFKNDVLFASEPVFVGDKDIYHKPQSCFHKPPSLPPPASPPLPPLPPPLLTNWWQTKSPHPPPAPSPHPSPPPFPPSPRVPPSHPPLPPSLPPPPPPPAVPPPPPTPPPYEEPMAINVIVGIVLFVCALSFCCIAVALLCTGRRSYREERRHFKLTTRI